MNWKRIMLLLCIAVFIMTGCGSREERDDGSVQDEAAEAQQQKDEKSTFAQGMDALAIGEYDKAILEFQQVITEEEDLEQAYRGIGIARMGKEDYEGAIQAFDQALAEAGAEAGALEYDISYYKASAMVRQDRLNDALDVYNRLVDYRPETRTYVGRGAVYARMGNMDMARADFDQAVSQDGKNYDLYIEIFQMLKEAGRTDIGQEYLKQALNIDKEQNKNNLEKGKVYYHMEQYDKARTELEKIKEDADPEVLLYLARVYEALGDFSYAESLYREYLEQDSSNGNIYNMIAVSEMAAGDYEDALTTVQEGLEKAAYGRQDLYRNEIVVYEKLLDFDAAKVKMEEYLANYPEDEAAAREYIFLKSRSR